ncbi:MAG: hypothetical protein KJ064_19620 [Anaerolineae bacterium]|nr:hypothetical protein [Anaerolineae bacterium]
MKPAVLLLIAFALLTPSIQAEQLEVFSALSRIPVYDWQTIAYTDFAGTMQALGENWPPETSPNETQRTAWERVWRPEFFSMELPQIGLDPYQVTRIVEARRENEFILWVEGAFNTYDIASALPALAYVLLPDFPNEAYRATGQNKWRDLMPYVALPGRNTLLIASSAGHLQTMLNIYDGHTLPVIQNDTLLLLLGEVSPNMTSSVLRFDHPPATCLTALSRFVAHGQRYDPESQTWQYILNLGFLDRVSIAEVRSLTDKLEYSTMRPASYNGVVGQHTTVLDQHLYESGSSSILQFVMRLQPGFGALPFDLATQSNTCRLFSAPDAAAVSLGIAQLQDLGAARTDGTIRYGNVEQAFYNAGLNSPVLTPTQILNSAQEAALNSTWRGDLAFENEFEQWFGFPSENIRQAIEMSFSIGDYERILWGDFESRDVETALKNNGYVALEQYMGTRIFFLREAPASGGFLLESLAKFAASPRDGMLILSNNLVNIRLSMDVINQQVRSTLPRSRDLLMTTRALGDVTNVIIHRYTNPRSGGLVCGLPPYRVEAFANVLRLDGWHFLYALGFPVARQDSEEVAAALAKTLENSDYPLQGPGSATLGELASVVSTRVLTETETTVIVVEMLISANDQQASFFGQDFAQANLPPCALGDILR